MAYTITSTKYPPRKPKLTIEADSLDDLSELTEVAEGSEAVVGGTTYEYDSVAGWVAPDEGGGGGGDSGSMLKVTFTSDDGSDFTCDKTYDEIVEAAGNGQFIYGVDIYNKRQLQLCIADGLNPVRFITFAFSTAGITVYKTAYAYDVNEDGTAILFETSTNGE